MLEDRAGHWRAVVKGEWVTGRDNQPLVRLNYPRISLLPKNKPQWRGKAVEVPPTAPSGEAWPLPLPQRHGKHQGVGRQQLILQKISKFMGFPLICPTETCPLLPAPIWKFRKDWMWKGRKIFKKEIWETGKTCIKFNLIWKGA